MIDRSHALPLGRQARELGISRGSIYYLPKQVSAKIASIAKLCAALMRTSCRFSHDGFQGLFRNPSESYRDSAVHRYRNIPIQPLSRWSYL